MKNTLVVIVIGAGIVAGSAVWGVQDAEELAGYAALRRGDIETAEAKFRAINHQRGLGLCALEKRDVESAAAHFRADGDTRGLALVDLARRDFSSARDRFGQVQDVSGQALCEMLLDNYARAESLFVQAGNVEGLGDLYARTGQWEDAHRIFAEAGNPLKALQCIRMNQTQGDRLEQALRYGRDVLRDGHEPAAPILFELADIAYELGDAEGALSLLVEGGAVEGFAVDSLLRRARLHFRQRDYDAAIEAFSAVLSRPDAFWHARRSAEDSLPIVRDYASAVEQRLPANPHL